MAATIIQFPQQRRAKAHTPDDLKLSALVDAIVARSGAAPTQVAEALDAARARLRLRRVELEAGS